MTKKEVLLKVSKELFGQCGYAETTFKKISERAGVALGLLSHHFGSKEKLFLVAGLDVLEDFLMALRTATDNAPNGYTAVMRFCRAYLDFSINPESSWLVLVRCSPYSDMKVGLDREIMNRKFLEVHALLEQYLARGLADGSIGDGCFGTDNAETTGVSGTNTPGTCTCTPSVSAHMAHVIVSLMVGANRTRLLTPYAPPSLYEDTLRFVAGALAPKN